MRGKNGQEMICSYGIVVVRPILGQLYTVKKAATFWYKITSKMRKKNIFNIFDKHILFYTVKLIDSQGEFLEHCYKER